MGDEVHQKPKAFRKICTKFGQIWRKFLRIWQIYKRYILFVVRLNSNLRNISRLYYHVLYICRMWSIYAEFLAERMHFFYKSQRGYCDIFHNPVLQLTFKNCILYDCTDVSIHCRVLTGACLYTAGITKQSCLTKTTVEKWKLDISWFQWTF